MIPAIREDIGATDPTAAAKGTIRNTYGTKIDLEMESTSHGMLFMRLNRNKRHMKKYDACF